MTTSARPVLPGTTGGAGLPELGHEFADRIPDLATPWRATEFSGAHTVIVNDVLAAGLGLDPDWLRTTAGARFLAGADLPAGARPVAMAYAGHQFGGYVPRLGDGRALLLGEIATPEGPRDLHLKGSGPTPFSRGGDGFSALGPALREFLMSGAMTALGIPTTYALAVVGTGEAVYRERAQPGAVGVRVATSHIRVGSFQYARTRPGATAALTDLAIDRHYPHLAGVSGAARYAQFYQAVIDAQARLVAAWQGAGFIHGVMNTDNTTISGVTIDYGPCAFLDAYSARRVFSSIDSAGRYAYGNQPAITHWNLARLGEALLPVLGVGDTAVAVAEEALATFPARYAAAWDRVSARKLGLTIDVDSGADSGVSTLMADLLQVAEEQSLDFTKLFRDLTDAAGANAAGDDSSGSDAAGRETPPMPGLAAWLSGWLARSPDPSLMAAANPVYIPRNHLVEEALAAATAGDLAPFTALADVLASPYVARPGLERYALPDPDPVLGYQTFCGT